MQPKKTHRLNHGEGSFYYRSRDARWVGTLEAGFSDTGSRRRIVVTDRNENKAWDKLQIRRKRLLAEGRAQASMRSVSVAAWLTLWLPIKEKQQRPKSFAGTKTCVVKWIIPCLGRVQLEDLTASHVRKLISFVIQQGRSSTYAGQVVGIFQKGLRDAIQEGYLVPEAPLLVAKPAKAVNDRQALPLEHVLKITSHLGSLVDSDVSFAGIASRWVAALLQGLRQGEALGLTWDRIDFVKKTVDISWQLQTLTYKDRGAGVFSVPVGYQAVQLVGAWHFTRPKTRAGTRIVPLVPWMDAALLRWQACAPQSPYGLVWSRADGSPISAKADLAAWKKLQADLGISKPDGKPYILHEARHTTATILLELGVNPEVVKTIMGHSDIITTANYQHVSHDLAMAALEGVAERMGLET